MTNDIFNITTLHDLLDHDARKFSSAEIQLKSILPEWIGVAQSLALKNVLQQYAGYVQQNTHNLQQFIDKEQINSLTRINIVMEAFIKEAREKMSNCTDAEVKDACLLASVQAINHYKISLYGTAAAFAKAIGDDQYASVFHDAEVKEKEIDEMLTPLAEKEINFKARAPIVLPGKT